MSTVTKKDIVDRIAEKIQTKHIVVKAVVQEVLDSVINDLAKGNRLEFRDFGVFETKTRAARTGQNPKTLKKVQIPSKRTVRFRAGRLIRKELSGSNQ